MIDLWGVKYLGLSKSQAIGGDGQQLDLDGTEVCFHDMKRESTKPTAGFVVFVNLRITELPKKDVHITLSYVSSIYKSSINHFL
jgi:hypothetical protein